MKLCGYIYHHGTYTPQAGDENSAVFFTVYRCYFAACNGGTLRPDPAEVRVDIDATLFVAQPIITVFYPFIEKTIIGGRGLLHPQIPIFRLLGGFVFRPLTGNHANLVNQFR